MCFSAFCDPNAVSLRTWHWTGQCWHGPTTFLFPDWALAADSQHNSTHSSWNLLGIKKLSLLLWLVTLAASFSCDLFKRRSGFCVALWECEIPYSATPLWQMWDGVKLWTQWSRPEKKNRFLFCCHSDFGIHHLNLVHRLIAMRPGRNWSKPTAEMTIDGGVHPSENTCTGAMRKRQAFSWPECRGCHQHVERERERDACSFWSFYQIHSIYSLMPGCRRVECQTQQISCYSNRCHKVLTTLPLAPVVLLTRHLGAAGIYLVYLLHKPESQPSHSNSSLSLSLSHTGKKLTDQGRIEGHNKICRLSQPSPRIYRDLGPFCHLSPHTPKLTSQ